MLRRGYRLHERLLRPARVVVAAAPPAEDGGEAGDAPEKPPENGVSGGS